MNYLEKATNDLFTYYTPKEIEEKILLELMLKNPPFNYEQIL